MAVDGGRLVWRVFGIEGQERGAVDQDGNRGGPPVSQFREVTYT